MRGLLVDGLRTCGLCRGRWDGENFVFPSSSLVICTFELNVSASNEQRLSMPAACVALQIYYVGRLPRLPILCAARFGLGVSRRIRCEIWMSLVRIEKTSVTTVFLNVNAPLY